MVDKYLVSLSAFTRFGPARTRLLISYFKSAEKVWKSPLGDLSEVGLSANIVKEFVEFRKKFDIGSYFEKLSKLNVKVTTYLEDDFPKNLKDLEGSPTTLYYKGTLTGLNAPSVAIVGTRRMTYYGKIVTEKFSGELSSFGVTIVSGLARGVDTAAHTACLSHGGITIAVLGNGLDTVYPSENVKLAEEIVKKEGAIVSEYPIGHPIRPENFTIRNRIVSGLSTCVLVVEGAERSGTLSTASHAAEQGKTVFAIPGQITSPLSAAPLFLLRNGATIATETKDILDELGIKAKDVRGKESFAS